MSLIKVNQGNLIEGETVELVADFSCNSISNLFYNKRWLVLGEKNLKYDTLTGNYYNEGEQNIFDAIGDDYITITEIKVGRYLAIFSYTNLRGEDIVEETMLTVFPKFELVFDRDITEGDTKAVSVSTTLLNTTSQVTFSDDNSSITITDSPINRTFPLDGYHDATVEIEYSSAKYDEVGEPSVIWDSTPSNRLVGVEGQYGGAIVESGSFTNTITDNYLTKLEISNASLSNKIGINLSVGYNGEDAFAPVNMFVIDNTNYFTLTGDKKQYWDMTKNLPTDDYVPKLQDGSPDPAFFLPLEEAFVGDNRIDYTELSFGDGQVIRGKNIDFEYQKTYYKSGKYQINYDVYTRQYVELTVEDDNTISAGLIKDEEDGRLYYTNVIQHVEEFEVGAFFTKWLREHTTVSLYGNTGFQDLTTGVGKQLDRLYNQGQSVIESIDVETMNDNFIRHFFDTYGDFEEIATKVGFLSFTKEKDDIYDYFEGYNFFDRIENGKATTEEKAEFLNYARTTQDRLQTKGTPSSIERELAQFGIMSEVVELWTDNMDRVSSDNVLLDEVFSGKTLPNEVGLTYEASSTPISDNTASLISNSKNNSYIEINSSNEKQNLYYTKDTPIKQIGCQKYAVFDDAIGTAKVLDYVFENLFDKWADDCIGEGLWARKYTSDFEVFGNYSWIDLNGQQWGDDVVQTLNNIGTDALYKEFVNRFGEMGTYLWKDFLAENWGSDIEAQSTFVQGVSGECIVSLESGQIIFGEYSQKSYDIGQTLYFASSVKLTDAYITDVHGVQENFGCLVDAVSGAEWGTTLNDAIQYQDSMYHYRVTIPTISQYFKGWVFNKDNGFVFGADTQFRLCCENGIDILTVEFQEEEVVVEPENNLKTFQEAKFACVVPKPAVIPEVDPDTGSLFSSIIGSVDMELYVGTMNDDTSIDAFNKCITIGDRTDTPSSLGEGEYVYFSSTKKLTTAIAQDSLNNELSLEYKNNGNFIKPQLSTEISNAQDDGGIYFYRWRVPKEFYVYHETEAFRFKATSNFTLTVYSEETYLAL